MQGGPWHEPFRDLFGDERDDYGASLQAHHASGPPADWRDRFVSAYASAHPWEDWAEAWAHYLHVIDTLETAHAFNLRIRPEAGADPALAMAADLDPYGHADFDDLIAMWLPLTLRGQQPEPQHGPAGSVSVRPGALGPRQAALHSRARRPKPLVIRPEWT